MARMCQLLRWRDYRLILQDSIARLAAEQRARAEALPTGRRLDDLDATDRQRLDALMLALADTSGRMH